MRRALLAAALLGAALLAPSAPADHVYSHRYVVEGRVLDAAGLPVPGVVVDLEPHGWGPAETCPRDPHSPATDVNGDFRFCFHMHELRAEWSTTVRVGNATVTKPMDTAFRRTFVTLVAEEARGVEPPAWNRTFELTGKVWRSGATVLEGVPVYGIAIIGAPVNITLRLPDGGRTVETVTTDGQGDYEATFRLEEGVDPAEVEVALESMGQAQARRLDTFAHRQAVGFILPAEGATPAVGVGFPQGAEGAAAADAPGTGSVRVPGGLFIGIAVAAVGTIVVRKWRERRAGK